MDGTNVTHFKSKKEDACKVDLVVVLHQPWAPEFVLWEIYDAGIKVLELVVVMSSWGEFDGSYVFCCTNEDLPMNHDDIEDNPLVGRHTHFVVINVI